MIILNFYFNFYNILQQQEKTNNWRLTFCHLSTILLNLDTLITSFCLWFVELVWVMKLHAVEEYSWFLQLLFQGSQPHYHTHLQIFHLWPCAHHPTKIQRNKFNTIVHFSYTEFKKVNQEKFSRWINSCRKFCMYLKYQVFSYFHSRTESYFAAIRNPSFRVRILLQ